MLEVGIQGEPDKFLFGCQVKRRQLQVYDAERRQKGREMKADAPLLNRCHGDLRQCPGTIARIFTMT